MGWGGGERAKGWGGGERVTHLEKANTVEVVASPLNFMKELIHPLSPRRLVHTSRLEFLGHMLEPEALGEVPVEATEATREAWTPMSPAVERDSHPLLT